MPRVAVRPRARADLFDIWDFIAADSPAQASAQLARLDAKFRALASSPGIGRQRDDLAPDLRSLAAGHHVIFYLATEHGIDIVRVLHGARDIAAQFTADP